MDKQRVMLLVLGFIVLGAVAVAFWSFSKPAGRLSSERARQNTSALQQQVGTVQSNPNVPPQVKQWLEYNVRQQQAGR